MTYREVALLTVAVSPTAIGTGSLMEQEQARLTGSRRKPVKFCSLYWFHPSYQTKSSMGNTGVSIYMARKSFCLSYCGYVFSTAVLSLLSRKYTVNLLGN